MRHFTTDTKTTDMRTLGATLMFLTSLAFGQNSKSTVDCEKVLDTVTNREIYNTIEVQAKVIGGINALFDELTKLKIPKDPDTDQIRILISFIVESNGEITGLRTTNKIKNSTLDEELLQLLKKFKWEPGTCKGVRVPSRLTLKVVS